MKKVWAGVLLLSLMVVGSVISTHNVSAYFKDNCYATQYEEIVNLKGDDKIPSRNVYSSDSVCYSNGSLSVKDRPNKKSTLGIGLPAVKYLLRTTPRYKIDGKKVVLTYCPNGRMVCAGNGKEKSFSLDDYGGDFEKLARDMDSFIAGLGNPKDCTKLDFGKNDVEGGIITASDGDASGGGTTEGGDDGETAYAGDACYNANANSQGWILCPTMRNLEYTAGSMDNILERWLSVDTNLYDASSPTAVVWEVMRNIANVIMVIIMLVIIFSQLTGVGIDNYGIKKMLPRLIAMAILINLSLVICELAIDLSNLLGTGLRNLFGAIGQGILEGRDAGDYVETFISTMVSVVMVAAGVVGAVAPTALTVHSIGAAGGASTTMIILVIVLVLLVVFAAIAVFFVMLAARMIIIIGCVALAPVAFALYILPNTQGLFKKWFTAFKTALVVFPICGAVSGISYIIKGIVLTADEIHIWMGVVGMMAPFLVFFMLPSLLRGVLGTLGKVGEALTTMGNHMQSGARGISSAVQNTDRFKTGMEDAKERSAAIRAQRIQTRLRGRSDLTASQARRLRRADDTMLAFEQNRLKDEAANTESNYEARVAAMRTKDYEEGLDNDIALLRQNGIHGRQYGLDSIRGRLEYLSDRRDNEGRPVALSGEERREVAVLTRAALGEKGGGGAVGAIMRSDSTSIDFKNAMGDALQGDSASRAKLSEKDAAAGVYAESFMQNGSNRGIESVASFSQFADNHQNEISQRINTYEAGLNQSGAALNDYIENLTPQQCQDIYDTEAYKVLSTNDLATFQEHARSNNVYGKSVQRVSLENGGRSSDRSGVNINGPGGVDSIPE